MDEESSDLARIHFSVRGPCPDMIHNAGLLYKSRDVWRGAPPANGIIKASGEIIVVGTRWLIDVEVGAHLMICIIIPPSV